VINIWLNNSTFSIIIIIIIIIIPAHHGATIIGFRDRKDSVP